MSGAALLASARATDDLAVQAASAIDMAGSLTGSVGEAGRHVPVLAPLPVDYYFRLCCLDD